MKTTIRTTIRVRKDLLDQSRVIASKRGVFLQDVINETLAIGFGHISDLSTQQNAISVLDKFRESLKNKKVNTSQILVDSKKDLR